MTSANARASRVGRGGIVTNLATAGPDIREAASPSGNMSCRRSGPHTITMSIRLYDDVAIAVPVSPRIKTRLQRAIIQGIVKPTGALPTLRRAVVATADELRHAGYTDTSIGAALQAFVEEVVRTYA